ncbi:MAG: T9SS type A sorting domain-containing protein [Cyclobacteriaceae bacterium]
MKRGLLLTMFSCVTLFSFASHLRCGYITAYKENCSSRAYTITITVFTNTGSDVKFGGDGILDFGDGASTVIPEVQTISRPDLGYNVGIATFTINHTYSGPGQYLISYVEPNRNGGVLNMTDSFFTTFYTETLIDVAQCSTPEFVSPPLFISDYGQTFDLSLGTKITDDSQITYEMVIPYRDRGTPVSGFWEPDGMSLNNLTGLLTWDTGLARPGEYNFAVAVIHWKFMNGSFSRSQFTRIDFQVIVDERVPDYTFQDDQALDPYNRILAPVGEEKAIRVFLEADDANQQKLEMYSALPEEVVSFTTYDSVSSANGSDIKVGVLKIVTREQDSRTTGYIVTLRSRFDNGSADINYLIYVADELPPLPVITATEDHLASVQVYPNPVSDFIQIDVAGGETSTALIYSAQGVLLTSHRFENNAIIDTRNLPAGLYICDVRRNNASVKKIKIIKSK